MIGIERDDTAIAVGLDELDGRNPVVWVESGTRSALDLEGTQLDAVVHVDTFWFAWGSFQPDTRIEP